VLTLGGGWILDTLSYVGDRTDALHYCRLIGLAAVLMTGAGKNLSVTEVALSCGFTHLSKFARDYQDRFGERPSVTLRHS